jgi:hypothetical protein
MVYRFKRRSHDRIAVLHDQSAFLQRLRTVCDRLPIAAQLEGDLGEADETAQSPTSSVPSVWPGTQLPQASP